MDIVIYPACNGHSQIAVAEPRYQKKHLNLQ